jgi:ectoine hydroxylase-related dioxygenase (phytanoyl-CoA dioxygenase family)
MLTTDDVARYHDQGFLALESFISAEEVDRMRTIYDRLFAERAGRSAGDQFDLAGADDEESAANLPQILNPSRYAPELLRSATLDRAREVLAELLGPDATFGGDHAINKPPRNGVETPWHQDEAYWDPAVSYHSLSIWIPLQEATVENGCMHFVPGSHRGEVVPHRPIGGDPRVHGLEVEPGVVDVSTAVACPIPAGGATIHASRTLHYTSPNRSADHRRAYIISGGTPEQEAAEPRDFPWQAVRRTARAERADAASRADRPARG